MKLERRTLFLGLACLLSLTLMAGSASATNLVVNGDFETGTNAGVTSDYTYVSPPPAQNLLYPEGFYAVGQNPNDWHNLWGSFAALGGSGYMMIVNGATTAGQKVWGQTVNVTPGTKYYFSTWVTSSYPVSPAELDFSINGTAIGSLTPNQPDGTWQQFYATWTAGPSDTQAILALVNQNTAPSGNDFCLDSIQMDTVPPATAPVPSSMLLLGPSLAILGLLGFRKKASGRGI